MKRLRVTVFCSVVMLTFAGSAQAVVSVSPPVRNDDASNLGCVLQNISGQAVEVDSRLENGLGTVVDEQTLSVPAGRTLLRGSSFVRSRRSTLYFLERRDER